MKKLKLTIILILCSISLMAQNKFTYPLEIGKVGVSNGQITLFGSTSGTNIIKSNVIAGSAIMFILPSANGSANYFLKTDGTGTTSWSMIPQASVSYLSDTLRTYYTKTQTNSRLNAKANTSHTQAQSTITALADSLVNKYTRAQTNTLLSGKAATSHTQAQSTITALADTLNTRYTETQTDNRLATKKIYHGVEVAGALSFDNSSHVLTVAATTNTYWYKGAKYTTTSAITSDLDLTADRDHGSAVLTANTLYYFYFKDATGKLYWSPTAWNLDNMVPVALVYWIGTAGAVMNEKHNHTRDIDWHKNAHTTIGARISPSDFAKTNPSSGTPAAISIAGGTLWDEDIANTLTSITTARIYYPVSASKYTYEDVTTPYLWSGSNLQYIRTSDYSKQTLANANWTVVWAYVSSDISNRLILVIQDQAASNTYANATAVRAVVPPSLNQLGISSEVKLIYRFVYQGNGTYDTSPSDDFRATASLPYGGASAPSASAVTFASTSGVSAGNVQAAVEELDAEKAAVAQTMNIGTTSVAINRGSGALALTGITSIDGTANIAGGTAGAIPYQSAANTTGVVAATATANKMLLSGASAIPTWSTSTIPTSAGASARKALVSDGTNYVMSSATIPVSGDIVNKQIQKAAIDSALAAAESITDLNLTQYDYIIEKVSSTYYARPTGSYTAYSNADATVVIQSAMDALTSGGNIYFKAGLYDDLDSLVVNNDKITLDGAGMDNVTLKLKANFDVDKPYSLDDDDYMLALIHVLDADYFTVKNITLDGNRENQTVHWTVGSSIGRIEGIYARDVVSSIRPDYLRLENMRIRDFTQYGVWTNFADYVVIRNCHFKDNEENNLNLSAVSKEYIIENNRFEGSNSVSVMLAGTDHIFRNNTIDVHESDAVLAGINTWGVEILGSGSYRPKRIRIENNRISGSLLYYGIRCEIGGRNLYIANNTIDSALYGGITLLLDSASVILGNKIQHINRGRAVGIQGCTRTQVINNIGSSNIANSSYWGGMMIHASDATESTYNYISGNYIIATGTSSFGIFMDDGAANNTLTNNQFYGSSEGDANIHATALTANLFQSNYGIRSAAWFANTGVNKAVTTVLSDTARVTDATYTFALTDAGKTIRAYRTTWQRITVPLNSSVAFPVGTVITVKQDGAGIVKFLPASGVTFKAPLDSITMNTRYSWVQLIKQATNKWEFVGRLED